MNLAPLVISEDARRVGRALEDSVGPVEEIGPARWIFALSNGKLLPVTARASDGWLTLEAPVTTAKMPERDRDAGRSMRWDLLRLNGRIVGASKLALDPSRRSVHVRADVPLDDAVDLQARIREACQGFAFAVHELHGRGDRELAGDAGIAATGGEPAPVHAGLDAVANHLDLAGLCGDAGWTYTKRNDGAVAIDLAVAHGAHQARVREQRGLAVQVSVELTRGDALSWLHREAIGLLLLAGSGIVRMARAAAEDTGAVFATRFEVSFASPPRPVELDHALSALSVACGQFGREARALQDDRVARAYLAAGQGGDAGRSESINDSHFE